MGAQAIFAMRFKLHCTKTGQFDLLRAIDMAMRDQPIGQADRPAHVCFA